MAKDGSGNTIGALVSTDAAGYSVLRSGGIWRYAEGGALIVDGSTPSTWLYATSNCTGTKYFFSFWQGAPATSYARYVGAGEPNL